ncbi:STAS domain-containing protein [Planotetraspora kaengkrachanensis]|uniref:Anti-sigma factor antagonist n=1 Tax=Planotetraspora kaengkrachanensis TaxID=575193 RepID=A0A8J3M5T5_9ACTN|nr:STAS domain-containing protein [Planotetraspora kaengkrachanensis]GIG77685.1 anti-sigma factor antagonist [Planotetraspora kaengkrachanensis]
MEVFEASTEHRPPFTIIRARGELDIAAEPAFHQQVEAIVAQEPQRLVFDLSELRFMDSSGLRVILDVYRRLGMGERVVVCGLSPRLRRIFDVTGITGRVGGITAYESLDDALKHGARG